MNSIVGPIFNEKVAKKWDLWVKIVKSCGYCSWTVAVIPWNECYSKKKKKKKGENAGNAVAQTQRISKPPLKICQINGLYQ